MNNPFELLSLLRPGTIWALTTASGTRHSEWLQQLRSREAALVSFRHPFRTRSNTTDFYYQQRFNSGDSEYALTVEEYLDTIPSLPGYWNRDTIVERLWLQPHLSEEVIKLSNGETRRVMIAAALLRNPSLLLLDHPMTGLDVQARNSFAQLLQEIAHTHIRVLLAVAPHDIPESVDRVANIGTNGELELLDRADYLKKFSSPAKGLPIDRALLQSLLQRRPPSSFQYVVDMKAVTIQYGDRKLLDAVDWTVRPGERWVLAGPNGAGKSTLLSLITGDNPQAYANHIVLFDRKRGTGESIWDIKKPIGFVSPELYQYFPTDSLCCHVIESGFYDTIGLFRPSDPTRAQLAADWMRLLHIDRHSRQFFSQVPSNVQRLCLLARALVKNPPLLVLDEPTQGLDEPQQRFLTELIFQIGEVSPTTIIYVSHYQDHVPANIRHRIELNAGRRIH